MLSLWRAKIDTANTRAHAVIGREWVMGQMMKGNSRDADSEPTEEYPKLQRTRI